MALIELNIEKPAIKRVESADEEGEEATEEQPAETTDEETASGSRLGRGKAVVAAAVVTVVGVLTLRKLRARRSN